MSAKVTTAVLPVAGQGVRMLPATKAVAKELITVGDRPLLQYALEEVVRCGVEKVALVISPGKEGLVNHVRPSEDLEQTLREAGRSEILERLQATVPKAVDIQVVVQDAPLGLGHAVLQAAGITGQDSFAVVLPDDFLLEAANASLLAEMIRTHEESGKMVLACQRVPPEKFPSYGMAKVGEVRMGAQHLPIQDLEEKPPASGTSDGFGVIGRYVLPASVMQELKGTAPGAGGEVQLTDAIRARIAEDGCLGTPLGTHLRYDCGSFGGWARANLAMWLANPDIRLEVEEELKRWTG